MIGKVRFTVGRAEYEFQMEGQTEVETLHRLIVLGNPPTYCTNCKTEGKVALDSNKDKEGNTYINVRCWNCGAKAKLGQYKTKGFFWHKFELYQKNGGQTAQSPQRDDNSGDIPF